MARRRMIDPDIWQNENFAELSTLAKLVFIGLFSNADDEGKGRAKPVYVKSMLFPYDETIRVADIDKTLQEIGSKMSVTFYSHNESRYYRLDNWEKWQRVDKPQPSKIPNPLQKEKKPEKECFESQQQTGQDAAENHSGMIPELVENDSGMIPERFQTKRKEVKENRNKRSRSIDAAAEINALSGKDPELVRVCTAFADNLLQTPGRSIVEDVKFYLQKGVEADAVIRAIEKTTAAGAKWPYTVSILKDWLSHGIKTLDQAEREEKAFQSRKDQAKPPSKGAGNIGTASSIDMTELEKFIAMGG